LAYLKGSPHHHSLPRRSWSPKESQVEGYEDQDDVDIHYQPFPQSISEEHEIYSDYKGCHRHHVKRDSYLSAHVSGPSLGFTRLAASDSIPENARARYSPVSVSDLECLPLLVGFDGVALREQYSLARRELPDRLPTLER
jgi:hypothetical protein